MSDLGKAAQARRFYHHVLNGGKLTPENVSHMVQTIEELEAECRAHAGNARENYNRLMAAEAKLVDLAAIRAAALREVLDDMWNLINAIDDEDFHGMVPGRPATIVGHYEEYHRRHIEHAQQIAESLTALIDKEQDQ